MTLSRKLGEQVYIGNDVCVTVLEIGRGKVRIGIKAPRDMPIYRQELLPLDLQLEFQRKFAQPDNRSDDQ